MIRSFILTLQFFTRLPIPFEIEMDRKTLSGGILFFPLVGMLVGSISWAVYYLLCFINVEVAALGALIGTIAVTGGLHLDGLADTCDGFFSARSRERILEIMKDSRVGTFGVIALVIDLLARYILLKNLPDDRAFLVLMLIFGASRLGAAMLIVLGKTARPGGLGDMFSSSTNKVYFYVSAACYTAFTIFLGGVAFLVSLAVMMIFSLLLMRYSYKIIGGLTGDVYGACIELTEIVGLVAVMVVERWM